MAHLNKVGAHLNKVTVNIVYLPELVECEQALCLFVYLFVCLFVCLSVFLAFKSLRCHVRRHVEPPTATVMK